MSHPPFSYLGPLGPGHRRVDGSGQIDIICRVCERLICKEVYRGFSTAVCAVCQGQLDRGMRPEEILDKVKAQEQEQADTLYNEIGPGSFKVIGLGQRVKDVVAKVKKAAVSRKRSALFSKKDKEEVKSKGKKDEEVSNS